MDSRIGNVDADSLRAVIRIVPKNASRPPLILPEIHPPQPDMAPDAPSARLRPRWQSNLLSYRTAAGPHQSP